METSRENVPWWNMVSVCHRHWITVRLVLMNLKVRLTRYFLFRLRQALYEEEHELLRAEQVIRPTGLLDPEIVVRPVEGQIDDLIGEVNKEIVKKNKVLITTLTKRMAEDLTDYMREVGIRVRYLHSDIDTLERTEIVRDMRLDVFDVLGRNQSVARRSGYSGDYTCGNS